MLPGINIPFQNGNLGQVIANPDGVFGLLASGTAVVGKFQLDTPYQLKSMEDVAALGILPDTNNYRLYKTLKEFFAEAGEGTELWLMGFAKTTKVSDWFDVDEETGKAPAEKLLDTANGKITMLFTSFSPSGAYEVDDEDDGMDADVLVAANLAQQLAENYTEKKYAPFFVLLEAYAFNGTKTDLPNLLESAFNRVEIFVGDSEKRTGTPASLGAAVGILAGRYAKIQVHVHPGKVYDGPLANDKAYILDTPVELYDVEALHDKGFVTMRTHVSKSGYYITDNHMACPVSDDYHYSNNRRVIDKAYRLAYVAALDFLLDDTPLISGGRVDPIYAKEVENRIESAIYAQMTANGELSYNPADAKDRGVIARVDLEYNSGSNSKLKLSNLQVRNKGTNRWVDIPLGFVPLNQN